MECLEIIEWNLGRQSAYPNRIISGPLSQILILAYDAGTLY
jgi:hypothetical protein